jgi:hypothetical protein
MSEDKIGQNPAYSVYEERDTYRDLCAELLSAAKDYLPYMPNATVNQNGANKHVAQVHKSDALKAAIAKAESILGENNAT